VGVMRGWRGRKSRTTQGCVGVSLAALLAATQAFAQTADPSFAEPTVKELQKEIRKRDTLIENLVQRVDKLERQVRKGISRPGASSSTSARAVAAPAVAGSQAASPSLTAAEAQNAEQSAPASPAATSQPPPSGPSQPSSAKPPAPGQFEVSPEAAERALERTLVATGNLLVPTGFAEVEPLVSYTRRETPTLVLFSVNRNELFPALDVRLGLPWEAQLEVALPWNFAEQQTTDVAVAPSQLVSDRWGNAVGDLSIGAAKTFVHESGWIPSLLGRVSWEIPTGPLTANGVPMTSGQNKLGFSVTALKRQDPLVFVATGGYTKAFQANQINPGNQFNFTTGAFLATSPETTLRGVLSQTFLQDVSINGVTLPGSNTVQPILTFGASSILGRGILVDLQVGFGLTNSAPKYSVILSSTYRFGVPGQ
jgi:hypothetical protein